MKSTIKTFTRSASLVQKASTKFFVFFIIVALLHGLSWGVTVTVTQKVFDAVANFVQNNADFTGIIAPLIVLAVVMLLSQVINALHSFVYTPFNQLTVGYFTTKIHQRVAKAALIDFEKPKFLDQLNKANEGVNYVFSFVFNIIMILTFFLPYVIYMAVYLSASSPLLILVILFAIIPQLFVQRMKVKLYSGLEDKTAPYRRKMDHYKDCICNAGFYKETRLLGAFHFFYRLFVTALTSVNFLRKNNEVTAAKYNLITSFLTSLGYIGVAIVLIVLLMKDSITVGLFLAMFAAIQKLIDIVSEMIDNIGGVNKNIAYVNNFLDFIYSEESEGDLLPNVNEDIVLDNVSFRYPGSSSDAIHNISIHIKSGETIALVGANGAGKSTLVRLITGLYKPSEGTVKMGGVDTKRVNSSAAFDNISGVFQTFSKYQMSLEDNVRISEYNNADPIEPSVQVAELNTSAFPEGEATMLSREFGGIDISGGQWQRLAIARAYFREHNLIVLDEPTSAIDPLEESSLYNRFRDISDGVTSVIVTHRIGSAQIADRILVINNGQIVEGGSHDELLEHNGQYKAMFQSQAQWYK